jgi:FkbM family methyltransferase
MEENYYGQFGEDMIIERYFPKDYISGCIDIGAADGIYINNTKHFEDLGWYCLCVEPNPRYFKELKLNRLNVVECAISNTEGNLIFTVVNLGNDIEDAVSALKVDERLLNQFKSNYDINISEINVKTITLDSCIEQFYKHDKIDFISIDTEGTELDVLKSFSIEKWNPKLLVIENNFNDPDIEIYLNLFGYKKRLRWSVNDYYTKK